jgi:hypothetical protein
MNFYMTHREDRLGQRCKRKSVGGCAEWCCQKHHSEWEDGIRAAGFTAGLLAGLDEVDPRGATGRKASGWSWYIYIDHWKALRAHVERTGALPKEDNAD